jgi:hypothetical protein
MRALRLSRTAAKSAAWFCAAEKMGDTVICSFANQNKIAPTSLRKFL